MTTFTPEPGGRVLWCLGRRTSDVRCVLFPTVVPIEAHVMQDRDLIIKEVFAEEWAALAWAQAYQSRLKQHGWRESPPECSSSSVS